VVIGCAGVGYRAAVSAPTLARLGAVGSEATLHTHLIARDDGLALYGFHSPQERELFLLLLSVQAIGPKVAMAVLSGGAVQELVRAIAGGDAGRFQAVPGIGKRTAERIIVELREKVGAPDGPPAGIISARRGDSPLTLAREGLLELGYGAGEAEELLAGAEGGSAEELITAALRLARSA
jgi:Holliday junction DNA helicase RuvA